jgi:hypothetical protein
MYPNSQYIQHGMDMENFTYPFATSTTASVIEIVLSLSFIDVNATYSSPCAQCIPHILNYF